MTRKEVKRMMRKNKGGGGISEGNLEGANSLLETEEILFREEEKKQRMSLQEKEEKKLFMLTGRKV